jgi:thiamine kinase-like enzyme
MAGTYLTQLVKRLASIAPTSRTIMHKEICLILSEHLIQIVDSYNTSSVIYIFMTADGKYLLKAEYMSSDNTTLKELGWYKAAPQNSPTSAYVTSYSKDKYAFLVLHFIEGAKTLDEMVNINSITAKSLSDYIEAALEQDRQFFNHNSETKIVNIDEADQFYLEKYRNRLREAKKIAYLKSLIDTPKHIVNGKVLQTPGYYISIIANNSRLHDYLTPRKLGFIHGDLHCGNILVKGSKFYLIDPNGAMQMPIEYDYGKVLHSIHGGYHQIMHKHYFLEKLDNGYNYDIEKQEVYAGAFTNIRKKLTDQEFLRGLYTEAMHFATLLPHHAKEKSETTALFLSCLHIFDELFYYLNIG